MQAWDRFNAELDASGGLVRSFGLDPSKRVLSAEARSDAGGEVVFAQYVVEADALEEIERWARRMPVMDYGSVEIRKVMFEGPR